ncbi:MAG: prepilin-type N-terminal cleavage/methylation domain-containing protein [Nitrospiria bacterium]
MMPDPSGPAGDRPQSGFTLLEIMISLAILAVIFTLIYGTFEAVYQGAEKLEEDADVYRLARFGIYHMTNNLAMLHAKPSPTHVPTAPGVPAVPKKALALFIGEDKEQLIQDTVYPSDSLEFMAVSHGSTVPGAPESDLTTVRYAVQDEILIQEMQLSNGKVLTYEIGGPIQGLNLRYYDPKRKRWEDDWDADVRNSLPNVVEIEFVLAQEGRDPLRFKTLADLPMGGQ